MCNEQVAPANVEDGHGTAYVSRDLSFANALKPPFSAVKLDQGVAAGNTPSHVVTSHIWDFRVLSKLDQNNVTEQEHDCNGKQN